MCRLFGYLGNDPALLPLALGPSGESLVEDCDPPCEGCGVGFYQEDRPLLRKRPKTLIERVDFREMVSDMRSRSVVGQVRRGSRGDVSSENTPPFRFRNWLFASQGEIAHTDEAHDALRARLPDFLQRNVRGQTDSELALHLFFDHLRKRANIESAVLPVSTLVDVLRETVQEIDGMMRACGQERPAEFNLLYLSGRMLVALQSQSDVPLGYMTISGVEEREAPLFAGHKPKTIEHPHFRGVFVAFDPYGSTSGWEMLPRDSILVVDEHGQPHISPLRDAA